jgi:hypothetical protein
MMKIYMIKRLKKSFFFWKKTLLVLLMWKLTIGNGNSLGEPFLMNHDFKS